MKSIEITAFLEGSVLSEALYHEIEHRIFESEPWKSLERNPEYQIEAFAYSTGILFRVRGYMLQESIVRWAFLDLLYSPIPKFSSVEKKRFLKELSERRINTSENFHERAGEEFLGLYETSPLLIAASKDVSQFSRITIVSWSENWVSHDTVRLAPIWKNPHPSKSLKELSGHSFHLFSLYRVHNSSDLVAVNIASILLRNRLREKFHDTGMVYDIHMSAHYESHFLYIDYYWTGDSVNMDIEEFSYPANVDEFDRAFKESYFLMRIGQEDHSFALNAIMDISTVDEQEAYENMSYQKYSEMIALSSPEYWWCSEKNIFLF